MRMKYLLGLLVFALTNICHADWRFPHGDAANTGFSNTVTAPAAAPIAIRSIGELAAGAGPVVDSDGNVYVGNLAGSVFSFTADGTYRWSRQLPAGQWVTSSPVIGADGSVYVVAETRFLVQGTNNVYRYESMLHKFSPIGDVLFQAPFPMRWPNNAYTSRGDANAIPNIWRSNGIEAIVVPAVYGIGIPGQYNSLRLIAFSTAGQVLGDHLVTDTTAATYGDNTVTGGSSCSWYDILCWIGLPVGFQSSPAPPCTDFSMCLPADTGFTQIGVAIWESGVTPTVVVSDGLTHMAGYTFTPAQGFKLTMVVNDARNVRTSTPMMLPDGHSVVGVTYLQPDDPLNPTVMRFGTPNPTRLGSISGFGAITGSLTRLQDGRLIAIERSGRLRRVDNSAITATISLAGESVAPASSSSNYLYVSSAGALRTFDVNSLARAASFPWSRGGRSSPAIGPFGHVYAVAGTAMYVWPPTQIPVVSSVQLQVMNSGFGSITSTPAGISCSYRSNRCLSDFVVGSQVNLRATGLTNPNNNDEYDFDHWEGGCAGSSGCSVTMDQAKTVRAVFVKVGNSGG